LLDVPFSKDELYLQQALRQSQEEEATARQYSQRRCRRDEEEKVEVDLEIAPQQPLWNRIRPDGDFSYDGVEPVS
jgi:hypothetical protein